MTGEATISDDRMNGSFFLSRLRWLIFFAWNIPPVFGLNYILMIGVLNASQIAGILEAPLEPAYILGWSAFSIWFLPRQLQQLADWIDRKSGSNAEDAQRAARRFPWYFWSLFLVYLVLAPASVIISAEIYTGFLPTLYDWFRIELVALIVSIIVGLPIFFLILDLFGRALGAMRLARPIVTIRTKVFLIGALVPLLIGTMLVQYFWTRTGYFNSEVLGVWLLLEAIAVGGSMIFAYSFSQALVPLQTLAGVAQPLSVSGIAAIKAHSTDEIGVLTASYRVLLEEQRLQAEMLELNNRLLRIAGSDIETAGVFHKVVELCSQALNVDQSFVLLFDKDANELVGVIHSGAYYRQEGHYRLTIDEPSLVTWTFKQGRTIAVADVQNDPRVSPRIVEMFGICSALSTPLRFGEEVIGMLIGVTHDEPRIYQPRDFVIIESLASEAAIALHTQQLREARLRAEAAQFEQQELFGLLLNSTAEGIYGVDTLGICTFVNQACLHMLGYTRPEDMIGKNVHALIHHTYPDGRHYPVEECRVRISFLEGRPIHCEDEVHWRADGSSFPVEYWSHPIYRNNRISGGVVAFVDITRRKQAEAELRVASVAFESQESLMITDANGVVLRVNQAFVNDTGYSAEEIVGQTPRILKSGSHSADFYRTMWESIVQTGKWQGEIWDRRKNGEIYPKWLSITAVTGNDGAVTHYIGSHIDITERKATEEKIEQLAFHDSLTRLPNRQLLLDRMQHALAASTRSGRKGALLFIDLDNFKTLNDTLGHALGDLLLQQVAERLTSCVREGDTVARLGGDEFVVMLEDLSEQAIEAAEQAEAVGEKILATLSQPYQLGTHVFRSSGSIGATVIGRNLQDTEELLKQADIAMYQAKKAGRNTLRFFDHKMQDVINARAVLEGELHKALENRQFQLYYQIQVDNLRRPLGAEALIRWMHPERGHVLPNQFISLAEETGLILPISKWVLESVCAQIKAWERDTHTRNIVLAVNISARQFRETDFVAHVQAAITSNAINPNLLKLELTESLLLDDTEDAIATMNALKAIGVRLSLDDFGTGYSSLQYLKLLPLDQIKIDQSFVRDIATDANGAAIVQTIIAMAETLGLDVIAEGVETEMQREYLDLRGCYSYQGYLFGKPVPIEQIEAILRVGHLPASRNPEDKAIDTM